MPRVAREVSPTGYYHVMMRGSGRMLIFEDDADRSRFVDLLRDMREEHSVVLIAWCLMDNHVHLVLFDDAGELSAAIHSVATAYAAYFNLRAGRVGPVFAGRFKSVPITSESQLLAAVRYVHDNPAKAGVCPRDQYRWSSFHEYVGEPDVVDTGTVLDMLGGVEGFVALSESSVPSGYCFRCGALIPDEDALDVARAAVYPVELDRIKTLGSARRGTLLAALRAAGLTVKQVERLTGVGRYSIDRATFSSEGAVDGLSQKSGSDKHVPD